MDIKELKENFNYPKLSKDKELLDFKDDMIFICNEYSFIDKYCNAGIKIIPNIKSFKNTCNEI